MIEARMRTTGAEAPSDAARTSSGRPHSNRSGDAQQVLLNRGNFEASGDGWPVGNNGSHVLTSTTSATDSGRQGDPAARHVVRQERQRKVACPAKAREAYFFSLCFTMRTGGPQKDFSIVIVRNDRQVLLEKMATSTVISNALHFGYQGVMTIGFD